MCGAQTSVPSPSVALSASTAGGAALRTRLTRRWRMEPTCWMWSGGQTGFPGLQSCTRLRCSTTRLLASVPSAIRRECAGSTPQRRCRLRWPSASTFGYSRSTCRTSTSGSGWTTRARSSRFWPAKRGPLRSLKSRPMAAPSPTWSGCGKARHSIAWLSWGPSCTLRWCTSGCRCTTAPTSCFPSLPSPLAASLPGPSTGTLSAHASRWT
mmetsp:Transcript_21033/g.68166  ORF Transcript_21033/g.68166 Transcript_21033/m.68166 type:complete len:210 (-) Transcript_21033:528-1157(-)